MKTTDQGISGILLAGVKSSRMDREKGSLMVLGKPLYSYPLDLMQSLCDEVVISTCKKIEMDRSFDQVCDEIPGIGPVGRIYSCLKHTA